VAADAFLEAINATHQHRKCFIDVGPVIDEMSASPMFAVSFESILYRSKRTGRRVSVNTPIRRRSAEGRGRRDSVRQYAARQFRLLGVVRTLPNRLPKVCACILCASDLRRPSSTNCCRTWGDLKKRAITYVKAGSAYRRGLWNLEPKVKLDQPAIGSGLAARTFYEF
jgi:hypothetical protein